MSAVRGAVFGGPLQIPQPTTELAIQAGIVLLALLIAVLVVTLGESVYRYRNDVRRDRVRADVEMEMLTRMSAPDPGWEEWTPDLSAPERQVARDLLHDYLETVDGEERANLTRLAVVLGVFEEARETLDGGARHERLQALGWLALAGEPVDPDVLERTCTDDSDLRAAAARVLYESDHPDARSAGTDLLLRDGSETLSVHGMDTLYQFHKDDPARLLDRGGREADDWRLSLLVQVLSVIEHCGITAQDADWEWVFGLTRHEAPSARTAAVGALTPPSWEPGFRERIDVMRLLGDPHRNVRRATYRMLGEWNDDRSRRLLAAGAYHEPDQRSRVVALTELVTRAELTDDLLGAGRRMDAGPVAIPGEAPDETPGDGPTAARTGVAVDVEVGSGTRPSAPGDDAAYDRAVAWVRADQEVRT